MLSPDPRALAERQRARDATVTARFPSLLEKKLARMAVSPLSYLRGAAALFYQLLKDHPELGDGPGGEGWLCGDAHLENFGVYRAEGPGKSSDEESVVFDVNDFDESVIGPHRLDVLRLVTSVILGGRELGADGKESLALSARLLDAYAVASAGGDPSPERPACVRRLIEKVEKRSHRDLLDRRTEIVKGVRRFVLGDRYTALPTDLRRASEEAFETYARTFDSERFPKERFRVTDLAFRIAGNGSLGTLRVAVLTQGKGGQDGGWIFDMKEEGAPSAAALVDPPALDPATRVLTSVRTCIEHAPRMTGVTTLGGTSMFVRRLAPQEDKLDLSRLAKDDLDALVAHLGALLGRAHHRGATAPSSAPWSSADQRAILERATIVAGVHEACYLALCLGK